MLDICDLEIVKNNFVQSHCYLINSTNIDNVLKSDVKNIALDDIQALISKFSESGAVLAIDSYIPYLMKENKLNILGVKNQLAEQVSANLYGSNTE